MYPVVVMVGAVEPVGDGTVDNRSDAVVCSIECARHNGHEPYRMAVASEYDTPCAFCGFDPADLEGE